VHFMLHVLEERNVWKHGGKLHHVITINYCKEMQMLYIQVRYNQRERVTNTDF